MKNHAARIAAAGRTCRQYAGQPTNPKPLIRENRGMWRALSCPLPACMKTIVFTLAYLA